MQAAISTELHHTFARSNGNDHDALADTGGGKR